MVCCVDTASDAGTVRRRAGGQIEERVRWDPIYNDFCFLDLGESAPWEFTPLTPLAKKRGGHIQISFLESRFATIAPVCFATHKQAQAAAAAHLCLSSTGSWK